MGAHRRGGEPRASSERSRAPLGVPLPTETTNPFKKNPNRQGAPQGRRAARPPPRRRHGPPAVRPRRAPGSPRSCALGGPHPRQSARAGSLPPAHGCASQAAGWVHALVMPKLASVQCQRGIDTPYHLIANTGICETRKSPFGRSCCTAKQRHQQCGFKTTTSASSGAPTTAGQSACGARTGSLWASCLDATLSLSACDAATISRSGVPTGGRPSLCVGNKGVLACRVRPQRATCGALRRTLDVHRLASHAGMQFA